MSDQSFAVEWLKAFRSSAEDVVALYAEPFSFTDPILDQHGISEREDLLRVFAPYANKDESNGIGINNFRVDEVIGDVDAAVYRWTWEAPTAQAFLGIPTGGATPGTRGITFHVYDSDGKITREESYWDGVTALAPFIPGLDRVNRFKPVA
ncbi:nuclear transport factor 2 family protein [soil metagenome]